MSVFQQLHTPVYDLQQIEILLRQFNSDVHSAGWYFMWDVPDINGSTAYPEDEIPENSVILLGSFDFTYYHQGEIVFHRVAGHNFDKDRIWPDHWDKDQIVLLRGAERESALDKLHIRQLDQLPVFAINIGSFGGDRYLIAAEGISIAIGTVFHYNRLKSDPLQPGERIAYWVS